MYAHNLQGPNYGKPFFTTAFATDMNASYYHVTHPFNSPILSSLIAVTRIIT